MCLSIGIDLLPKNNSNLPSDVIQGRVFDKIDYGVTCLPVKIGKQKYRQSPTKFLPQHVNWFVEFTNICELPLHVALLLAGMENSHCLLPKDDNIRST